MASRLAMFPVALRVSRFAALLGAVLAAPAAAETPTDAARRYFHLLVDEKFVEFCAACDDTMKAAMPDEKLKEVWAAVGTAAGAFEKELGVEVIPVGELTTVELLCKFATATLKVRTALNKEGKIAGLFFVPASDPTAYQTPAYVDPSRFQEEEVTVRTGLFELPGTLTLPKSDGPVPGVVLIHGSGPHDRDETVLGNKPFLDLAWGLGSRGIAVLRYEKRTLKYAMMMDPTTLTLDAEATDDAVSAARLLLDRKGIDGRRVFVLGHSLGAMAAPRVAQREPRVAGVILFAGAARSLTELVPEQIEYLGNLDGRMDPAETKQLEKAKAGAAAIRDGTWKPGDTLLGAPAEYWAMLHKIDVVAEASTLNIPMLIAQGSRDYQVVTAKDFAKWQSAMSSKPNVTLKLFDGMDHLFRKGEGPSSPQQYGQPGNVDESVIEYLADWIRSQRPAQ